MAASECFEVRIATFGNISLAELQNGIFLPQERTFIVTILAPKMYKIDTKATFGAQILKITTLFLFGRKSRYVLSLNIKSKLNQIHC